MSCSSGRYGVGFVGGDVTTMLYTCLSPHSDGVTTTYGGATASIEPTYDPANPVQSSDLWFTFGTNDLSDPGEVSTGTYTVYITSYDLRV